jgi:hypothetical protein
VPSLLNFTSRPLSYIHLFLRLSVIRMTTDTLQDMPLSPSPRSHVKLWSAVALWARGRRARALIAGVVFVVLAFGVLSSSPQSLSYKSLSNYNISSLRPHVPTFHSTGSSVLNPSQTTLEIENGTIPVTPSHLTKMTPNFHLLMPALDDSLEFCQSTLSAMLLNYPPPTAVNLFKKLRSLEDMEKSKMEGILGYLSDTKLVDDEDLVLIADGYDVWFQLPSDVMIQQYENVLEDANKRLLDRYGYGTGTKELRFNQTVVFGAEKMCDGEEAACSFVPESMLPKDIYGTETGTSPELSPAKYLNAGTIMGPAKDLRAIFETALLRVNDGTIEAFDMQSILTTMFAEQYLARESARKSSKPHKNPIIWLDVQVGKTQSEAKANLTLMEGRNYEYSMGLDYTHSLFQPFYQTAEDELIRMKHDNSTDFTQYHHLDTPTPPLTIPAPLESAIPPYYIPSLRNIPHPNKDIHTYIKSLEFSKNLDILPNPKTSWSSIPLITNTYTAAIPALLHANAKRQPHLPNHNLPANSTVRARSTPRPLHQSSAANITFSGLWYSKYSRALLRKFFRTRQSPFGYHAAAVGGDRLWDRRGGRGGVWTAHEQMWYGWGEVDGVCGTAAMMDKVFADGKGIWLLEGATGTELNEWRKKEDVVRAQREKEEKEWREIEMVRVRKEKEWVEKGRKGMVGEAGRRVGVSEELEKEEEKKKNGDSGKP